MSALNSLSRPHFRSLGLVGGALLALAVVAPPASAQGRPDQLLWRNQRGQVSTLTGTITENSLSRTTITSSDGKESSRDSSVVVDVIFGTVPPAFVDGEKYADLGDYENAAAKFSLAAGDASARGVVKARARLRAVEALMKQGAKDPEGFAQAKAEAARYLGEHLEGRGVPRVRLLQARATRLAGDPAAAAELYRSLYNEAATGKPTTGYPATVCFRAGLAAAECFLAGGDTLQARQLYGGLETALPQALSEVAADDPTRPELLAIQAEARLGEGYAMLASGSDGQAKTFFEGQLRNASDFDVALRCAARLGLAETLLKQGKHREAQLEFAQVAAIDHTDRDRVARALVGLAACALALPDASSRNHARTWLQTVQDQYGDTPSAAKAAELSQQ